MKKFSMLPVAVCAVVLALSSCSKYEAKDASLNNQNDSLNFALGVANGEGIKNYYMKNDSSDKPVAALMSAMDQAFKAGGDDQSEVYKIGMEIGNGFKQQKARGLMGDSTLKFDEKLVRQGMINGLNGFSEGMTAQQAQEYIQKTMMRLQQEKMAAQQGMMPQQAPQAAPAQAPQQ